jgi:TusA-related sulfurtransferase
MFFANLFWSRNREAAMAAKADLDLTGVVSPICLLQLKSALSDLAPGDILCVSVQDPDVTAKIQKIVERSRDKVIDRQEEGSQVRISIRKG